MVHFVRAVKWLYVKRVFSDGFVYFLWESNSLYPRRELRNCKALLRLTKHISVARLTASVVVVLRTKCQYLR